MIEYRIHTIDPDRDLPTLNERILRLPDWRRRNTLSYIQPIDRLQSAIAYELLAGLLREYRNIQPGEFQIEYDCLGKPSIHNHPGLFISLGHCRKGVIAAISDSPVGCDIEVIQRPYELHGAAIADFCFNLNERRKILTATDPALMFTKLWTIKEAAFKLDNTLEIESIDTTVLPATQVISTVSTDYVSTVIAYGSDTGFRPDKHDAL